MTDYTAPVLPDPSKDQDGFNKKVAEQFHAIAQSVRQAQSSIQLKVLGAIPKRVSDGLLVYADGVGWDPGQGQGLYLYEEPSDTWVFIGNIPTTTLAASAIVNTPAGGIASTNVQAALNELDTEKVAVTNYDGANILARLILVDGTGSGLDADLLDGVDSTAFSKVTRTLIAATTRNLALTDAGNVLWNNTAGAVTLTIPTHASVALPVATQIDLLAWNTTITVAAASGVTLHSPNSLLTVGPQFAGATLIQVSTDNWALFGGLQ